MPPSDLELNLPSGLPEELLPPELPVAHLTVARWLPTILSMSQLVPRLCNVFGEELLYFSYGGVFYRTSKARTEAATELPVGMVFSPKILDICSRLYPFDSGAMATKAFGDDWYTSMQPFEKRFVIETGDMSMAARTLVQALYGSNSKYIEGRPVVSVGAVGSTMQLLHAFLDADLSGLAADKGGIDHRQRSIEALSRVPVLLAEHLIWIGLPFTYVKDSMRVLRKLTRRLPVVHPYKWNRNFSPDNIAEQLQDAAHKEVVEAYIE